MSQIFIAHLVKTEGLAGKRDVPNSTAPIGTQYIVGIPCNSRLIEVSIIAGLDRSAFDNKTVSFDEHVNSEHNMWHYLHFIVLLKVKDTTEFTGPESYVSQMIKVRHDLG